MSCDRQTEGSNSAATGKGQATARRGARAHRIGVRVLIRVDLEQLGAVGALDIIHMGRAIELEHRVVVAEVPSKLILVIVLRWSESKQGTSCHAPLKADCG